MTISTVKLSQLRLSPLNVRSSKPAAIDALAQDIAVHGVIQSLSVYEAGGHYHVFAGGRRFRALKRLAKAKTIGGAYAVPVIVRTVEEARELSLAENVSRQAMHVADCVIAFGRLRDELGLEPQNIAMRFGVPVDYVRRVLKLSALAPVCLTALAKDDISLSTAQALTLTDDQDEQIRLLELHGDNGWQIKRALTCTKVEMNSGLFRFVGVDAYTEAGGTITRDLFDACDEGYADHPALLQTLAAEKLAKLADDLRNHGWQTITTGLERPDDYYNRPRSHPDSETGDYAADIKLHGELHLFIGRDGSTEHVVFGSHKRAGAFEGPRAAKADWSASLVHDLSVTRTMVLQQQIAQRPDIALDLLLATLIDQLGFGMSSHDSALSLDVKLFALKEDAALTANESIAPVYLHDTPMMERFGEADSFEIIRQLDDAAKMQLLSHAVAQLLNGVNVNPHHRQSRLRKVDAVADAIGLDMEQHWKATPHLFARAGKATTLKVLTEQFGQDVSANVAKLKKGELATVAADRLSGTRWLPPAMMAADWTTTETDRVDDADETGGLGDARHGEERNDGNDRCDDMADAA